MLHLTYPKLSVHSRAAVRRVAVPAPARRAESLAPAITLAIVVFGALLLAVASALYAAFGA